MVSALLDQLLIFLQLYLIELLGLLTDIGLLKLQHLIYQRLMKGFGILIFFANLNLMEFQIRYLALFLLFLSNRQLQVVLDWKSSQEHPLNSRVSQGSILPTTLFLLYYTLMTFLMMLSVILLSMLMILLSILSVIRHLIYGSKLNWLLNLNLTYEILNWGKKWLVDFNAGKTQLVSFDRSNNAGAIDGKMDGSVLEE